MNRAQPSPPLIASRDNPRFKRLRELVQHAGAYRRDGMVWIEGDHLLRALLARGGRPQVVVLTPQAEPLWQALCAQAGLSGEPIELWRLSPALMQTLSRMASPAAVAALWPLPPTPALEPDAATVVLDRVQDPGNVGSILRSAAAFGFRQVLALQGTAALWASKVLRAGMGAHFGLRLHEGVTAQDVAALRAPLLATSSHHGEWLHRATLPWPCAWVLGHEGQGVQPALLQRAARTLRIAQPGGEESLNVAAAAAICLHASATQRTAAPA